MDVTATVWTLLPPIIAIALALITKEVYSSLMIGILSGALLYTGFHPLKAVETTFTIMGGKLGDNINICIFLVLLGILVSLITKSGASRAYGEWRSKPFAAGAARRLRPRSSECSFSWTITSTASPSARSCAR